MRHRKLDAPYRLMPLDRIVAVLNMDMIGRNKEVTVGGGSRFSLGTDAK